MESHEKMTMMITKNDDDKVVIVNKWMMMTMTSKRQAIFISESLMAIGDQ